MGRAKAWWTIASEIEVIRTSLTVALGAGTFLNAINQGPQIWRGLPVDWARLALTFVVPYAVSTIGAVSARRRSPRDAGGVGYGAPDRRQPPAERPRN